MILESVIIIKSKSLFITGADFIQIIIGRIKMSALALGQPKRSM